jgi:hypothetical protein
MVYIAQQSFGYGEVDPNIRAQYESAPYQRGCQTLENAFLSDTGSALKRWGSVTLTTDSGQYKAYEFINGFGERYLIANDINGAGNTSQYKVMKDGVTISTYDNTVTTTVEYVRDVASDGIECFVLTTDGIYVHKIEGTGDNRSRLDALKFDLINSVPEMTFQITDSVVESDYEEKRIKAPKNYFEVSDTGDLYKIYPSATPSTELTPRFLSLKSNNFRGTEATHTTPEYPYKSPTEFYSRTVVDRTIVLKNGVSVTAPTNHTTFPLTSSDQRNSGDRGPVGGFLKARIYFNGATSLYTDVSNPSVWTSNGGKTVQSGDTIGVEFDNASPVTSMRFFPYEHDSSNGDTGEYFPLQGTQSYKYVIDFGFAFTDSSYGEWVNRTDSGTQYTAFTEDQNITDWSGPYRNWKQVGKPLYTGTSGVSNVIDSATWSMGYVKTESSLLLSNISTSFDSDHSKALCCGAVGKFDHYVGEVLVNTTYFYVQDKQFYPDAVNVGSPKISLCWGSNIWSPTGTTNFARDVGNVEETLVMCLASSDNINADGLPAQKLQYKDTLVRRRNNDIDLVGVVGYPGASTTINTYVPTWTSGAISSVTTVSQKVHCTKQVGDINPAINSEVFRVSSYEYDSFENYPNTTTDGQPGSQYWKLTGEAFAPKAKEGTTNTQLVWPNNVDYHQSRVFIGGFTASQYLSPLNGTQGLGLTIISSKSGNTRDFTTGPNDGDGLSFVVASKKGGKIQWIKSMFNQLFVGTESEEFAISDVPITPSSINISLQSAYGSEPGAGAVIFDSSIAYISTDGKSIRLLDFNERTNRFESSDILQFAKHLVKTDRVTRIDVVHIGTPLLFALTENGKLHCFTSKPENNVYGWSQWSSLSLGNFNDIVGTADSSGNPALYARVAGLNSGRGSVLITTDHDRLDYLVDNAYEGAKAPTTATVSAFANKTVSVVLKKTDGTVVYLGDFTANSSGQVTFDQVEDASKLILGYPFTMRMAPNIPEIMLPGKGNTLGREKNISRLRILFNQARGAVAAGYSVLSVPKLNIHENVPDAPGFYSIPVVGSYGPQPTVYIQQSASYGFEVSGYNAEYDFGD